MDNNIKTPNSLTEEEEQEAIRIAEAARRAEDRAAKRAIERALEKKRQERGKLQQNQKNVHNGSILSNSNQKNNGKGGVVFLSRKRRLELKEERVKEEERNRLLAKEKANNASKPKQITNASRSNARSKDNKIPADSQAKSHLTPGQLAEVKRTYLGSSVKEGAKKQNESQKRARSFKKITFKFEWDNSEDTSRDVDPLYDYSNSHKIQSGILLTKAKNKLSKKSGKNKNRSISDRILLSSDTVATVESVSSKQLSKMTPRDWRIFRENFDIIVKGGKAPPPLRSFRESPDPSTVPNIHPSLINAIEKTLRYKHPSPIQRQAIPIGLQRRDLIGIAETGSGKTAAFGIPLCHHIFQLPKSVWDTVERDGPLALIMAPTRELALQIDIEIGKLLTYQRDLKTLAVVGGQEIQNQAYKLRDGIHIVVGTPGRINDCVEMSYLVLNQCSYIVLDEADRMIDLGFAPQIEQILEAMGGMLKSDDEKMAYQQEIEDLCRLKDECIPKYRLTAMFSATMPSEVERIAKKYLRHPAVVSIGDRDSRKNTRIVQKILYLSSPSQKVKALTDILHQSRHEDKIIVFVNEKKHADGVGRMVENAGRRCVVLHGGKAQDQREENLETFRRGGVVLVATDVAGRGLDIPNVSHVINYDLPTRSIDNYSHRIGRTGRAGKEGIATSFITDEDTGIMSALVQYLESTNNQIPEKLRKHPSVISGGSSMNINF